MIARRQSGRVLSLEAIERASDVADFIYGELLMRAPSSPQDELVFVSGLSPGLRMVWGTMLLDNEVNNGGFDQFFWNTMDRHTEVAIDGLQLIGAVRQAELVRQAHEVFVEHDDELRSYRDRDAFDAYAKPDSHGDLWCTLDAEYYERSDLDRLRVAYIRSHIDEFVLD